MRRRDLHDAGFAQTQIGADRGFLLGLTLSVEGVEVLLPPTELRTGRFDAKATVGDGAERLLSATTDRNGTTVFLT